MLKGATIIESLVAMTILVTVLGIASMIFSNVLIGDNDHIRMRANNLLKRESARIVAAGIFLDREVISENGFSLRTHFETLGAASLVKIHMAVVQDRKIIAEYTELVCTGR